MANQETLATIKAIREDLQKALDEIGAKYGYRMTTGAKTTYDEQGNFMTRLTANKVGAKTKEQVLYERYAEVYTLPPLGTAVKFKDGSVFITEGLTARGKILLSLNGKRYKMDVLQFVRQM